MASFVYEDSSEATEQNRFRRSRINGNNPNPLSPSPPSPQISPLLQSARCKPTISSIFLSTFTTNNNVSTNPKSSKKKNFSSATFRGLGCTNNTSSQVSTPAVVIRSSADWQAKKVRKKKLRKKNQEQQGIGGGTSSNNNLNNHQTPVVVVPDVWCAPGIGFSADTSVDCVVSRRPVHGRGRIDGGERVNTRERSCITRRGTNVEHISLLDSPTDIETSRFGSDVHGGRHHRHFRHRSPGGLAEIMMFQSSLMMGGRLDGFDRHRDLRLDVDRMSYEELLELGDKIGYVSTGLKEDEIFRCLRKTKHAILGALSSRFSAEIDWKCSICQEEYEQGDEVGKMECGHSYHMSCIKQWLLQKNTCPVCKVSAISQFEE